MDEINLGTMWAVKRNEETWKTHGCLLFASFVGVILPLVAGGIVAHYAISIYFLFPSQCNEMGIFVFVAHMIHYLSARVVFSLSRNSSIIFCRDIQIFSSSLLWFLVERPLKSFLIHYQTRNVQNSQTRNVRQVWWYMQHPPLWILGSV